MAILFRVCKLLSRLDAALQNLWTAVEQVGINEKYYFDAP